ncbi:MAG TPA: methyltransferase domain-containing protein [Thermodesulfovibrionales bacterium]|nr:methyltransferase domain-containing protein [Thermodesulfovibrionales bacterium]
MVFNERYAGAYDALYRDKDYEKECDYIESLFRKHGRKPRSILDLGCGTGGHALILAQRGYRVTGIDRSSPMLEIARSKAKGKGAEFIKGDITKLRLNRKFDAVISMFAVMGYQTANDSFAAVCKLARRSLSPGGLFMFDCWHGPAVLLDRPTPRIKEIDSGKDEKIIRYTLPEMDVMNHIVNVNFRVWRVKRNSFKENAEVHPMRFFFPQEVIYFLEVAGFDKVRLYPFFEIDRELTDKDWNMMVVGAQPG